MPHVLQLRGGHLDSTHPFSAVAIRGGTVQRIGPEFRTPWRSAAKPFQLWCSLEALGDPELSPEDIAIGAASHSAQAVHVARVRGLMERFGLQLDDLACYGHPPIDAEAEEARIRAGEPVTHLHNNCSGKHTFMVAAARNQRWEGDYREAVHPLQVRIRDHLEDLCGARPDFGIDGCGVPSWVLEIGEMARAWERLALDFDADTRLGRIGRAMMAHPELTSGTGRIDALVMAGRQEPMVVKVGAQALYCIALPARKLAVVLKVHTGVEDAMGEAIAACLHHFAPGAWRAPADWPYAALKNVAGRVVGERVVEGMP